LEAAQPTSSDLCKPRGNFRENASKYNPTFIKHDAEINDAKEAIVYWQSVKDKGIFDRGVYFAICLKESGIVIGAVTVDKLEYLYELQIGWMMKSQYTGKGYASEAGAAVSDYLLETFSLDYISVVMDVDNPASFRTAQKVGLDFLKASALRLPLQQMQCRGF
jgi:Acetyltransferases, including N-acetylases of ribosomal proteins